MNYSISELSSLAGVSTRTLRYYDEMELLKPKYVNEAGYRFYGPDEVDRLQQILFFRERGFELKSIRQILDQPDFDLTAALEEHLQQLEVQKERIESVIGTVRQTLLAVKGAYEMSDKEKFAAFKEKIVQENEEKYGKEIRQKYGEEAVAVSNGRLMNMSEEEYQQFRDLGEEICEMLEAGVKAGWKSGGEDGKIIFEKHKKWLMKVWKNYSVQAHRGVAQMYVMDERFTGYYDKNVNGCTQLLKDIICFWTSQA